MKTGENDYISINTSHFNESSIYRITFLQIVSAAFGWFAAKWFRVTVGKCTKNASFVVNGVAPNIIIAWSMSHLSNELMRTWNVPHSVERKIGISNWSNKPENSITKHKMWCNLRQKFHWISDMFEWLYHVAVPWHSSERMNHKLHFSRAASIWPFPIFSS